jgi:hypothetical protein
MSTRRSWRIPTIVEHIFRATSWYITLPFSIQNPGSARIPPRYLIQSALQEIGNRSRRLTSLRRTLRHPKLFCQCNQVDELSTHSQSCATSRRSITLRPGPHWVSCRTEHSSRMAEMFISDRLVAVNDRQNSHSSSGELSERSQWAEILSLVWFLHCMYLERKKSSRRPGKRVISVTMF